ncbi:MAG: copper resistance CopC family protein, partial [Actinomycetota bacterium]
MVRSPESTGRVGRFVLALVLAAAGLALLADPASAHTSLVASSPASGERVAYSPDEIVLTFATAVDPRTVTAELRSADGEVVAVEPLSGETGDTTVVAFAVPRLPHAVYGLAWQSVGDDGHRVLGEVLFGVGTEVGGTTSVAGGATPMARA